jgi:hypothetical protein
MYFFLTFKKKILSTPVTCPIHYVFILPRGLLHKSFVIRLQPSRKNQWELKLNYMEFKLGLLPF